MYVREYSVMTNAGLILSGLALSLLGLFLILLGTVTEFLTIILMGSLVVLIGIFVATLSQISSYSTGVNNPNEFTEKIMSGNDVGRFKTTDFNSATDTSRAWRTASQTSHTSRGANNTKAQKSTLEADSYKFFDISKIDSESDIDEQYRVLVKEHHPDSEEGTTQSFKELQDEYKELKQNY